MRVLSSCWRICDLEELLERDPDIASLAINSKTSSPQFSVAKDSPLLDRSRATLSRGYEPLPGSGQFYFFWKTSRWRDSRSGTRSQALSTGMGLPPPPPCYRLAQGRGLRRVGAAKSHKVTRSQRVLQVEEWVVFGHGRELMGHEHALGLVSVSCRLILLCALSLRHIPTLPFFFCKCNSGGTSKLCPPSSIRTQRPPDPLLSTP